jgi:hypothetical protein
MIFNNISNFYDVSNYLPILNGIFITDLFVLGNVVFKKIKSKYLIEWYKKYGLLAIIADVLSIMIGIIIARFIYTFFFKKFNILLFCCLAVSIQLLHDILFAFIFNLIPRGKSNILDTFKDYGNELGFIILFADASMIISSILLGSLLSSFSLNTNIILLISLIYISPYLLYSI